MTKRLMPMLDDPRESSHVRELLEAGRSAPVSDYDFEQGLRRHLSQIEAGAALPQWAESLQAGATAAGSGAAGSSLWLWIGLPVISVAAISAVVMIRSAEAPAAPAAVPGRAAPAALQQAAEPVPTTTLVEPVVIEGRPQHRAEQVEPNRAPRRARTATVAPSQDGAESVEIARRETSAPALPLKAEPGATIERTAKIEPGDKVERAAAPAGKVGSTPAPRPAVRPEPEQEEQQEAVAPEPEPKPAVDEARLEREMAMLAMTQRVLFTDAARALNLARQGEAEFEGSMFTQERQQLLLLALVKLGRVDEAKRLARPYLSRYPHGPFSDRVRRALATGRVDR